MADPIADEKPCECYDDLFQRYPDKAIDAQKKSIDTDNIKRVPLYLAVRYLLTTRFGFDKKIPGPPKIPSDNKDTTDILHTLSTEEKAYFLGVIGLLMADSYTDPTMGRPLDSFGGDDISERTDDGDIN